MKEFKFIKQIVTKKLQELDQLKLKVERSLKKAPEGSLVLSKSNGTVQYFHKTSNKQKKGRYIKKIDQKQITALAQKDYDQRLLKEVEKQTNQLTRILKNLPEEDLSRIYDSLSEPRKTFVTPHIILKEKYIEQWLQKEYRGKVMSEETPFYVTNRGEKVRSKSEKIIADKLFSMGIPYRYEYPIRLKNFGIVYPDFTLLNMNTRKEVYFEHFGMMDHSDYRQKAFLKLQEYARNGIYPGKNLLVTFETLQVPLDMNVVEKMLRELVL